MSKDLDPIIKVSGSVYSMLNIGGDYLLSRNQKDHTYVTTKEREQRLPQGFT